MRSWVKCFAACGLAVVLTNSGAAQVKIQIQAQPLPAVPAPNGALIQISSTAYGVAPNRLASSDAIFVGRVVAFEPMDIEAAPAKGQPKVTYRIAVVQVTEALRGLQKDAKMVRVGFVVANNAQVGGGGGNVQIQPAIQPLGGARRVMVPNMVLQVGQDGLFFLAKHGSENFLLGPTYQTFVNRQNNTNFDNEVKSAKQICKVLDNPAAALKSEDKDERFTGAAILVSKYRGNNTGLPMKQVPIDAAESKLILKALAEGDWNINRHNAMIPSAYELFNQLGISVNDGYKLVNVRNQQDIFQGMKKWLEDNGDKYVIKKLVSDPNAKAPQPMPGQPGALGGGFRAVPAQVLPVPVPAPVPAAPKKNN